MYYDEKVQIVPARRRIFRPHVVFKLAAAALLAIFITSAAWSDRGQQWLAPGKSPKVHLEVHVMYVGGRQQWCVAYLLRQVEMPRCPRLPARPYHSSHAKRVRPG